MYVLILCKLRTPVSNIIIIINLTKQTNAVHDQQLVWLIQRNNIRPRHTHYFAHIPVFTVHVINGMFSCLFVFNKLTIEIKQFILLKSILILDTNTF